jgi:hypothetical protein
MKNILFLLLFVFLQPNCFAQKRQTENLIIVVLDGMRWQEIFSGADSVLLNNPAYTRDRGRVQRKFWDADPNVRRKKLLPFIWSEIGEKGQLYGNRHLGNKVDVTNPFKLTYPGFSEMLTGYADPAISSNRLVVSKSDNVLEFITANKEFAGKVSVFATSDLFPFLLDRENSKLYINSDTDTLAFNSKEFQLLNEMQRFSYKPTTERPDLLTFFAASQYLKAYQPRVLYLALGETDAFAHAGQYDHYLETAHAEDVMIADLWKTIQTLPQYKNKTTLVLTCDHGRGDKNKDQWVGHGPQIEDSGEIWIGAIGPDTRPLGEVKTEDQLCQRQLAPTLAALLGLDFRPKTHQVIGPIKSILQK